MKIRIDTNKETVWFTSDTHFGHKNIMKFCPDTRPYSSVEENDEALIANWNAVVGKNDTVYHLGDFFFYHDVEKVKNILLRLNGKIYFVRGNHDQVIERNLKEVFSTGVLIKMVDYLELSIDGQDVTLCHYPLAVWNKNHRGAWNLHGHCHGSFPAVGKQLDVGCDSKYFAAGDGCRPLSFAEIKAYMDARPIVVQDHHDPANGNRVL